MIPDTPTANQEDKFWASEKNKENLHIILRKLIQKREQKNRLLIFSSLIHEEHLLTAISSHHDENPAVKGWIEEADSRQIKHIERAIVLVKSKRSIIISNDSNTFLLLLYYFPHYLT